MQQMETIFLEWNCLKIICIELKKYVGWDTHNLGPICQKVRADRGRTRREQLTTQNSEAEKENIIIKIDHHRPRVQPT